MSDPHRPAAQSRSAARPTAKKAPAVKATASKSPVKKAPAAKAPTPKAPAKKAPVVKAATSKAPVKRASAAKAPASKASVKKASPKKSAPDGSVTGAEVRQSRFFKRAQKRAEGVLSDPEKMRKVAAEASDKSQGGRTGPLSKVLDELSALIRMTVAYARGNYREVSGQSMLLVLAGLIYFVSPIDVIPDFVPGGYFDDVAVLGWVIKSVRKELDAFIEWETGQDG